MVYSETFKIIEDMDLFLVIVGFITGFATYMFIFAKKNSDDDDSILSPESNTGQKDIKPLLINTLNEMNCEPVVDEKENTRVDFTYQGQNFSINIDDNSEFITLWYPFWSEIELDDLDEVSRVSKAINYTNQKGIITMCYVINNETNRLYTHSQATFLFNDYIPNLKHYLTQYLQWFFMARKYFEDTKMEIMKNELERNNINK